MGKRRRSRGGSGLSDKFNMQKGIKSMGKRDVWKQVGAIALGSLAAGLGVSLSGKVVPLSLGATGKYAVGGVAAAAITAGCFAFNYPNAGIGAATITANQALNTVTNLVLDKSVSELVS